MPWPVYFFFSPFNTGISLAVVMEEYCLADALWNTREIPGGRRSADVSILKGDGVDEHGS